MMSLRCSIRARKWLYLITRHDGGHRDEMVVLGIWGKFDIEPELPFRRSPRSLVEHPFLSVDSSVGSAGAVPWSHGHTIGGRDF